MIFECGMMLQLRNKIMDSEWLKRKQRIEKRYKDWHSYDIGFNGKKFCITKPKNKNIGVPFNFFEMVTCCVQDLLKKPLAKSTVLDLGCMEGIASFALAKKGVKKIVGIDGRKANITKAKFAKETLGFDNVTFKMADVRKLKFKAKSFDVVLALGILYHLDTPELFYFIENLFKWTKEITIIDTHFAYFPKTEYKFKGKAYPGFYFNEFVVNELNDGSIGNNRSFWLTRTSLFNMLIQVGYTGIYECKYPRGGKWRELDDRFTIIATKEKRLRSSIFRPKDVGQSSEFEEKDPRTIAVEMTNFSIIKSKDGFSKS